MNTFALTLFAATPRTVGKTDRQTVFGSQVITWLCDLNALLSVMPHIYFQLIGAVMSDYLDRTVEGTHHITL